MKPKIFIGSSSESAHLGELVKEVLEPECECTIWKKGFFELNKSTYDNLVKKAICFDYAIFIGGKDDFVERVSSKEKKNGVRDNVYLELGLYAGILSKERSYFLVHANCKVASDLMGITLLYYKNQKQVKDHCEEIRKRIQMEEQLSRITLLPSTSLAYGYYENFLKDACAQLYELKEIMINNKCYDLQNMNKLLVIIFPESVVEDWREWAKYYYNKNRMVEIEFPCGKSRPRGIKVRVDMNALENQGIFRVVDIPQTLRAAFSSVDLFIGKTYRGEKTEYIHAKVKEVNNFEKTLKIFMVKNPIEKELITFEYKCNI